MVSVMDDALLLPNEEVSEDVSDTSKACRPSQSAPPLRERTFIRESRSPVFSITTDALFPARTSDNDHKKRSSRTRPTCPLPARAQNANTRSIDSVVPVPAAVHSIVSIFCLLCDAANHCGRSRRRHRRRDNLLLSVSKLQSRHCLRLRRSSRVPTPSCSSWLVSWASLDSL